MKNNFAKLILMFALLLMFETAYGQSTWDRYETRPLKQIVKANYDPNLKNGYGISAKEFASIAKVTFTGLSRKISPEKKKLILA